MKVDRTKISAGRIAGAWRVGIYGPQGVGKTTFASGAPDPFFLDIERGTGRLNVAARVTPESWEETLAWVDEFTADERMGRSIVIDSVTRLEALMHRALLGESARVTDTIEKFDGGYGRGDTASVQVFRELLAKLDRVLSQGRHVILIAHSTVKKFEDPAGAAWERYELGVRPKLGGTIAQWLDFLAFARPETIVVDPKAQKKKAAGTGMTLLHTTWSAAYDAKARGELVLPDPLPLSWADFAAAVDGEEANATRLRAELRDALRQIGDEAYGRAVLGWLASNPKRLGEAHAQVTERLTTEKEGCAA